MTTVHNTLCYWCKYFDTDSFAPQKGSFTCGAFPGSIPAEIIYGEFDHRTPHPDDQGIQFEKYDDSEKLLPFIKALSSSIGIDKTLEIIIHGLEAGRRTGFTKPPLESENKDDQP